MEQELTTTAQQQAQTVEYVLPNQISPLVQQRMPTIDVPIEQIHAFCKRNRIRRLALFGSVCGKW